MDEETNGGAEGYIVLGPGLEVDLVEFGALRSSDSCRTTAIFLEGEHTAVVISLWPGRRRDSWTWMSSSVILNPYIMTPINQSIISGLPGHTGGTPSMIHPTDLQ